MTSPSERARSFMEDELHDLTVTIFAEQFPLGWDIACGWELALEEARRELGGLLDYARAWDREAGNG